MPGMSPAEMVQRIQGRTAERDSGAQKTKREKEGEKDGFHFPGRRESGDP